MIKREDAIRIMACEMYAEAQSQGHETGSIEDYIPEARAWMNDAPSADRPSGEWKPIDLTWGRSIHYCTNCEESLEVPLSFGKPMYDWCPLCGARMKGADDE